ncbi:MAG TPA: ABC transporter substrate-binding protein [Acidimicrobiales bacterium]|nr:ABC transporter substrate-binding protein [Acidimicrobiales bacterium]
MSVAGALSLLAGLITACGGTKPAATATLKPTHGGSITVDLVFSAFGLAPWTMIGSVTDGPIGDAIYDPLMQYGPSNQLEPWLATSLTTKDDQVWTMQLHQGVKFQDGTPFNAAAVVFNIDQQMNPANHSFTGLPVAENIASVKATGPDTVVFNLKFPWSAFSGSFTGPFGYMASPTAVQKEGTSYNQHPVGTGPFDFVQWVPGDHVTVKKNPNYWVKGEPYLNQIVFKTDANSQTRLSSVETGEAQIDQTIDPTELGPAKAHGLSYSVAANSGNSVEMNTQAAPFNNANMRLALRYATDLNALNKIVYNGLADPVWAAWISPSSPYYDKSIKWPGYDPAKAKAKAKAMVTAYTAKNGPVDITYSCYTDPAHLKEEQALQQMWKAAGFNVTLNITDQNTLVINMLEGHFQIGCLALGSGLDPDSAYYSSLYSKSPSNFTHFNNPAMDAALTQGRESTSVAVREQAYNVVQQLIASDMPAFQTEREPWGWIWGPRIGGVVNLYDAGLAPGGIYLKS